MRNKIITLSLSGLLGLAGMLQSASARFYDNFNTSTNWTLINSNGTAVIASSELTLTAPPHLTSNPSALLKSTQAVTNSRQSILVRSHLGATDSTVFFLWATDSHTGNQLELKLDDTGPTVVVAGFYTNGVYHYEGSTAYSPGPDGLYMGFRETNGVTYWEASPDADTWTEVASAPDPVNTSSMTFEAQHKAYVDTADDTYTVVDCFNYKATGAGYHSIQDSTNSGGNGWELYTEGFYNNNLVCSSAEATHCDISVNGVDATQHFIDTSIPEPYTNQMGYDFQIISTDAYSTHDYYNAYRYQNLPYVDADNWTYHLYFKYTYPQYITQGLEFPLNKYTGTNRLQGAVAWYPLRDGTDNGLWKAWDGASGDWVSTGQYQEFTTDYWYEVTFTVGLHDNNVYYSGFQAGTVGSLTNFTWNATNAAPASSSAAYMVPAMQIDDNTQDTTEAGTQKDCYLAEWHIDWTDEKLH